MAKLDGFDRFLKEHRAKKTLEKRYIVIGEREYEIAPVLPASLVLTVQRLQREYGNEADIPPEAVIAMTDSIFGNNQIETIARDNGLDMNELGELLKYVMDSYLIENINGSEGENSSDPIQQEAEPETEQNHLISLKNGNQ